MPPVTVQLSEESWLTLGSRLRAARKDRRIQQRRVARLVGISGHHLGEIERGEAHPSVPVLLALVSQLGLSLDEACAGLAETATARPRALREPSRPRVMVEPQPPEDFSGYMPVEPERPRRRETGMDPIAARRPYMRR